MASRNVLGVMGKAKIILRLVRQDLLRDGAVHLRPEDARLLVIDDEPTIRMLVAEVLAESGYAVIEAPDGPAGM